MDLIICMQSISAQQKWEFLILVALRHVWGQEVGEDFQIHKNKWQNLIFALDKIDLFVQYSKKLNCCFLNT